MLSEDEFINRILARSTGQAHDLILEWKTNGMDAAAIFHNLLVNYDRRITAEEARSQLMSYKVGRNGSLADAESRIVKLIGRASTAFPVGESRKAYYNLEGCNALIRALPPYSSQIAHNLYSTLTAKLGRACTLLELSQGLNLHRANIDKDIKEHGSVYTKPMSKPIKQIRQNYKPVQRYMVNSVEVPSNNRPRNSFKNPNDTSYTPRPKPLMRNFQNQNNYQTRKPFNNNNNRTGWRRNNSFQNNNYNTQSNKCLLCGLKDHTSKECTNIRDDNNNPVQMLTTYGTCSKCPRYIFPRLHHQEELCPYRSKGPLNKKN
jgi:hypothetical protein